MLCVLFPHVCYMICSLHRSCFNHPQYLVKSTNCKAPFKVNGDSMAHCYISSQDDAICDVHIDQKEGQYSFLMISTFERFDLSANYMPNGSSYYLNYVFTWLLCLMSVTLERNKTVHLNEHQMLILFSL